eukprot:g18364.t1
MCPTNDRGAHTRKEEARSAHTGREQLTRAAADDLRTETQRNTPEKGRETCQCCRNLVREEQSSRKSSGCYSNGSGVDAVCRSCRPPYAVKDTAIAKGRGKMQGQRLPPCSAPVPGVISRRGYTAKRKTLGHTDWASACGVRR